MPLSPGGTGPQQQTVPKPEDIASAFLDEVKSQLGVPYQWGGTRLGVGLDCSGLVQAAAAAIGVSIPRTTTEQWAALKHIDPKDVQPGDLVYFVGGDPPSPGHVGVVDRIGNWQMINEPHSGLTAEYDPFSIPGSGDMQVVGFARLPGVGQSGTTVGGDTGNQPGGGGGGLFSLFLPGAVLDFFTEAEKIVKAAMWFASPENWMRILAGIAGALLAIAGIVVLTRAA